MKYLKSAMCFIFLANLSVLDTFQLLSSHVCLKATVESSARLEGVCSSLHFLPPCVCVSTLFVVFHEMKLFTIM